MRNIVAFFIFNFFFVNYSFSQRDATQFAAGFNTNIGDYNALNTLLYRYNASRDWLEKDMDYLNQMNGFVIEGGQMLNKSVFAVSFTQRSFKTSSEGASDFEDFRRDLKMSINSFGVSYGYFPTHSGIFRPVVGLRMEVARLNMSTRTTGPTGTNLPSYNRLDSYRGDWMMFLSPFFELRITPVITKVTGIAIRPYMHYGLFKKNNISKAGTDLIFNLDTESFPERYNDQMPSFGLEIKLVIGINQNM